MKFFDPALLHTLTTFADCGTLAKTARIVGRTPSAVTSQMQRLEELADTPLLREEGRRRVLTEAGERLLVHARRILAANGEAFSSISDSQDSERIGLGATQDFTERDLPLILNQFARSHPLVKIDLRIGSTSELSNELSSQQIDVLLATRRMIETDEVFHFAEPMRWLSAPEGLISFPGNEIPLAFLDPPCPFRDEALKALEASGKPFRLAATSSSLAGIMASVRAGIAITARTGRWISPVICPAPQQMALPNLPDVEFCIRVRRGASQTASQLATLLSSGLHP